MDTRMATATLMLLGITAFLAVPIISLHAQEVEVTPIEETTVVPEKTGLFTSLRERQIQNREKIKTNLRALLDETNVETIAAPEGTAPVVIDPLDLERHAVLTGITGRLQNIAERLEGRIILTKSQITLSDDVEANLITAQEKLIEASATLLLDATPEHLVEAEQLLREARSNLEKSLAALKRSLQKAGN